MYSNVTKDWSASLSLIVSSQNILNIGHLLCQLCYLIISFNLHNSFMKYLLFLSYDICKIGLANWSWPKVKRKVSGGTRTNRRPPECWAHYIWAKYSLLFLVPGFLSRFCPDLCAWGWPWQPAFPGLSCPWNPMGAAKQMRLPRSVSRQLGKLGQRDHWVFCPASFLLLRDSSYIPLNPACPSPSTTYHMLLCLCWEPLAPEVAALALSTPADYFYLQRSSLPGWQAPTAPAVTSAAPPPSARQRPPAQVSPTVSPGVFSWRDPSPQDFLQLVRESFVPIE